VSSHFRSTRLTLPQKHDVAIFIISGTAMDFSLSNLRRLRYSTPVNNTAVTSTQLPNILDAFIPGYTFFCKLTRDTFGFDLSNIAFAFLVVFASATSVRYLVNTVWWPIVRFFTAAVTVDSNDFIHDCLLSWAAQQPTLRSARSLHVHSVVDDGPEELGLVNGLPANGQDGVSGAMKAFPQYEIYKGAHWFWHNGHYFKLAREDQQVLGITVQNREKLTLTVLGRSTQPIKELIIEARDHRISELTREKGKRA
jgi:mitochondrial chaperone BCS1